MTPLRRTEIEVAPAGQGWIVTRLGLGRDSTHPTKEAATQRGVQLARERQPSELTIRRLDGSIQETRHYGADPKRLLK